MKTNRYFSIIFFALFLLATPVSAQWLKLGGLGKFTKKKRYWSVGMSANSMHYFGDIVPKSNLGSMDIKYTRPNIGVFAQKRFLPRFTGRMAFAWGQLAGSDHSSADPTDTEFGGAARYKRNLHFRNNLYELSTTVLFDFIENQGLAQRRPDVPIPYLMFGVAAYYHNPQAIRPEADVHTGTPYSGSKWVDLRPLKTENQDKPYSAVGISIPVGIGVRYKISTSMDVGFEVGYRFTFTDYLDDVGGMYIDLGEFDDPLVRSLHDRSAEPTDRYSGEQRNPSTSTYVSKVDGRTYTTVRGYGTPNNIRGGSDKDAYFVMGFHVAYIFSFIKTPKYR